MKDWKGMYFTDENQVNWMVKPHSTKARKKKIKPLN